MSNISDKSPLVVTTVFDINLIFTVRIITVSNNSPLYPDSFNPLLNIRGKKTVDNKIFN